MAHRTYPDASCRPAAASRAIEARRVPTAASCACLRSAHGLASTITITDAITPTVPPLRLAGLLHDVGGGRAQDAPARLRL
eukprot:4556762-Prymnesium_polylepis.1